MYSCHSGRLLAPDSAVLNALGKVISFEVAVGLNGRVWVKAPTPQQTIIVANAISGLCLVSFSVLLSLAVLQ